MNNGNRMVVTTAAILVATGALASLGLSPGETADQPVPPAARAYIVEMRGFEFIPAEMTVAIGDTILWINRDPVPHTATARDSSWDSGRIEAGDSLRMVVGGEFGGEYFCVYHPMMTGMFRLDPERGGG